MAKTSPRSASITKIENELTKLKQVVNAQELNTEQIAAQSNREELDSQTRQEIAKLVTWLYFGILLLIIVGLPLYNLMAHALTGGDTYRLDFLDILQGYQAVVGTLVGFVIAYYFKERAD